MTERSLTPEQKEFHRKWIVLFTAVKSLIQCGLKFTSGILTGSTALLADAIHSLADVAGELITWAGVRLASYKSEKFPYGFCKIENLLAIGVSAAIVFGAWEVFQVFLHGRSHMPSYIAVGIAVEVASLTMDFFWGRFERKTGRLINSPGIEASGSHTFSDAYASLVVMAGLAGSWLGLSLDRWAALFVAIFIAKTGLKIFLDNVKVLLDISLLPDILAGYFKIVSRQPSVRTVFSIRGRNAGSFRVVDVDVGVRISSVDQAEETANLIKIALKEKDPFIDTVSVHCRHEFPEEILIFVPTDANGGSVGAEFGKTTHFAKIRYLRATDKVLDLSLEKNYYFELTEHLGIKVAEYLIDKGADSVCCRENLSDKGPGLMFHRFGIDVRLTDITELDVLLTAYFANSSSVFQGSGPALTNEVAQQA